MSIKYLVGLILIGAFVSTATIADDKEPSNDEIVAQILAGNDKPNTGSNEQTVARNPASGFWTCHGIRLHMGVDMASWTNLDSGEMFILHSKPAPTENGKGTDYLFSSTNNPAVIEYFVVDKSGKKLSIRDQLKFSKLYPCKRTK